MSFSEEYLPSSLSTVSTIRNTTTPFSRKSGGTISDGATVGTPTAAPKSARHIALRRLQLEEGNVQDDGEQGGSQDHGAEEPCSEHENEGKQGKEETDCGVLQDFTTYLEKLISEHRAEKGKTAGSIILEEKEVVKLLKNAKVKFMGFSSNSTQKTNKPKRFMSSKTSVFRNRTNKEARYMLRESTEDMVVAQVTTKKGFCLGVATGLTIGAPTGGGGLLVGGSYSRGKEKSRGSSSVTRREMEASATVEPKQQLLATESVYHTDYEAICKFDFTVIEGYELKYKGKVVKVRDIGFEECEQDFETEGEKKVHISATFHTTLTSVEHVMEFEVEPIV